ncbi:mitochondrial carrier domain-containing protein [Dactylonectria estremocensis]|uniref:Mitochondrial carrier domain-containing protein n=1 Tax=Dactylonectria estremocensis TaxID=1079267 RepID=A0A9P9EHB0_9HYPO|nr:mitochondrial carrier domain-containing protein [Dactylonectria estremocensis]
MSTIAQHQPSLSTPGPVLKQQPVPAEKSQKQKQTITPAISLAAGAVAGAVEATITYPFEFAKTRSQLSRGINAGAPISKNPFSVILHTARHDGVRAIYTGCSTLILGTACKAGVRFLSFDAIKTQLVDSNGRLSPARGILAGMIAGAVESVTVVTPTERIKTALIDDARSSSRRYNGGFQALRTIFADQGVAGIYRGLISTTLKQSATSAVRMGSYNILKETVSARTSEKTSKHPITTFAMGAAAGIITVYATQPFDTIKTRAQGAQGATTAQAFHSIWRDGGVQMFWSGSSMRLGRLILSGGIVFTVYENVASVLMGLKR